MNMLVQLWFEFFFNGPVLAQIFRPASYNFNMNLAWETFLKKIHSKRNYSVCITRETQRMTVCHWLNSFLQDIRVFSSRPDKRRFQVERCVGPYSSSLDCLITKLCRLSRSLPP